MWIKVIETYIKIFPMACKTCKMYKSFLFPTYHSIWLLFFSISMHNSWKFSVCVCVCACTCARTCAIWRVPSHLITLWVDLNTWLKYKTHIATNHASNQRALKIIRVQTNLPHIWCCGVSQTTPWYARTWHGNATLRNVHAPSHTHAQSLVR